MKKNNNEIFQKRKRIRQIYEYLVGDKNEPLNNSFF
jgi:hypothetical protein